MPLQPALAHYTLHLADNALILGHRNSEWTGRGPILEQDIALSNIALDLIGQARNFYQYAAQLRPQSFIDLRHYKDTSDEITEDSLAYLRDAWDFKNCLLVEQSNGDWAKTMVRQFFFSTYQFYLYQRLQHSADTQLAAISEKAYKEVSYHLRWSSEWVIRLGDGTDESHDRMEKAVDDCWKFTAELYQPAGYEQELLAPGVAVDLTQIQPQWEEKVREIFAEATLELPSGSRTQTGGKEGRHTEELGYLLAEMQFLQRAYPGGVW